VSAGGSGARGTSINSAPSSVTKRRSRGDANASSSAATGIPAQPATSPGAAGPNAAT
jgi:hypothetical protein